MLRGQRVRATDHHRGRLLTNGLILSCPVTGKRLRLKDRIDRARDDKRCDGTRNVITSTSASVGRGG